MLAQRLLCVACAVWLGAAANVGGGVRSVRELREGDAHGRIFRPVIPRSPPVRVTNAHAGVDLLDENVATLSERRRKAASSPDLKKRPFRRARVRRPASRRPSSGPFPAESSVNHRFARKIVEGTLKNVRSGARLISARGNFNVPLVNKLIDNATLIRENIVEGFSCDGRIYGYYADQLNECQIFHICVPMKQMFPNRFTEQDVFHFSFICPKYTIFSQDSMVCAWSQSAVPCSEAHHLYDMNKNFFVVSNDVPKEPAAGGYPSPGGAPVTTGSSGSFPQYPGAGTIPVNPAPSPVAVPAPYPAQSGTSGIPAVAPTGVPPAYPGPGGVPVNPAPAPAGIPPAYPGPGGVPVNPAPAPVNPAPAPTGVPPAYPGPGGVPVNPAPAPTGVPPAYPGSGGVPVNPAPAPVNPAPAPTGVPPAYPVSGGAPVNPAPAQVNPAPVSTVGVPPASPVSSSTAVNPTTAPAGIPPAYPSPAEEPGDSASGAAPVNPAPSPIPAGEVDPSSASGAPLPNSYPLGEGVAASSTDGVDETTLVPEATSGGDAPSSSTADSDAPLPNSIPLATNYNPDQESVTPSDLP